MDSLQYANRAAMPKPVFAAAALGGAAGLVCEIVWIRLLALEIGATAPALAWVLALFFGGLAVGSAMAARATDARRSILGYVVCEGIVGLFAVASPAWIGGSFLGIEVPRALRPICCFPPAVAMGATLPLLCRSFRLAPREASVLYVVNTLGGAVGVGLAGFLGMEWLGLRRTLWCAAAFDAAAIAALIPAIAMRERGEARAGTPTKPDSPPAALSLGWVLSLAFLIGAVAITGEVILNRLLYQVLGGTVYAITGTLLVYLLAIAAGSAWGLRRREIPNDPRPPIGAGLLALGVTTAVAFRVLDALAAAWRPEAGGETTPFVAFARSLAVGLAVLAPPALASGFLFPWLVRLRGGSGASALGAVYATNTLGSIAASLGATFLLVPWIGTAGALGAAGLLSIAAAALAARGTVRWVSAAALAIVAISLGFAPAHPERFRLWLYDTLAEKPVRDAGPESAPAARETTIVHVEGVGATASVFERVSPSGKRTRDFAINGKKEASTDFEALRNQLVLGHLPMLLHRDPKNALVVGLGAGVTAGAVAVHPGAHVTVAELNPEVARATREFADANHGVLERPNVSLVFEDGRRVVRDASTRAGGAGYDVITSDPIHPWVSGAANLYTADYFHSVYDALAPGGVAAHWLPLYEMRVSESLAILRSFAAAFAKSYLWITYAGDAVILGFKPPYALDLASFASRAQEGDVAKDLKGVRLDDPLRLLAGLALEAGAVTKDPRILPVTDDRPYLEFRAARNVYIPHTVGENLAFFAGEVWPVAELLRNLGITSSAAEPRLQTLLSANRAMMRAVAAVAASDPKAADLALEAWAAEPDGEQLAPLLDAPGLLARLAHPNTAVESLAAGAARARLTRRNAKSEAELARELAAALEILRRGLTMTGLEGPVERGLRRQIAVILGETKDYEGALEALRPLLEVPEPDPSILRIAARAEQRLGRDREAADLLARAAARDFRR